MMTKNNEKLLEIITWCKVNEIPNEQRLKYVNENGFKIDSKTYKHYDKKIEKHLGLEILEIPSKQHVEAFLIQLDMFEYTIRGFWNLYLNAQDDSIKKKSSECARDMQKKLAKVYKTLKSLTNSIKKQDDMYTQQNLTLGLKYDEIFFQKAVEKEKLTS